MLQNLLEQLRNAGSGSKVIAGLVLVAVIAIGSTAAVVARRPHFELLYSNLTASDSAQVQKALAGVGIPFEQSSPPGPFMIYVDKAQRYKAQHAVASAGALDRTPGGILPTGGGMSTVFMGADERDQVVLKRQWQEMEHMLEVLDFVAKASVTTTPGSRSAFGKGSPRTGSVMLELRDAESISRKQAKTIANLVRFGLDIEPEHLNISDQRGVSVFDGSELEDGDAGRWLEQKAQFERNLEERANERLAAVLGPGSAYVTVNSTWNQDLTTKVAETADPSRKVVLSEYSDSSQTPQGAGPAVGGAAGPGSNAGDFGLDSAPVPSDGGATAAAESAKTDSTRKQYWTPTETTRTVRVAPVLERLSISLFMDQNRFDQNPALAARQAELESSVKAAVGFDSNRTDAFSSVLLPFFTPPVEELDPNAETAEPASAPSPMLEMLLERGVEIVSALAFLFLLVKALKSSPGTAPAESDADADPSGNSDEMMELLAQAQIEELVKSDPERVGQILSSWAVDEKVATSN